MESQRPLVTIIEPKADLSHRGNSAELLSNSAEQNLSFQSIFLIGVAMGVGLYFIGKKLNNIINE